MHEEANFFETTSTVDDGTRTPDYVTDGSTSKYRLSTEVKNIFFYRDI